MDDYKWLTGSIRRDLEPDERGVWADLLALAGLTREPRRGYIERSKGIPYDKTYLLMFLNISEELFDRTLVKCEKEGRLKIYKDGTMFLTNWNKYNNLDAWHKAKDKTKVAKKKKSVAIDKAIRTKNTIDNIAQSATQACNRLNAVATKLENKTNEIEVK